MRLERDEHFGGRAKGIERQHPEGRRAIHEDEIKRLVVGGKLVAQDHFAADGAQQLELGPGQVDMAAADSRLAATWRRTLFGSVVGQDLVERRPGRPGSNPRCRVA